MTSVRAASTVLASVLVPRASFAASTLAVSILREVLCRDGEDTRRKYGVHLTGGNGVLLADARGLGSFGRVLRGFECR